MTSTLKLKPGTRVTYTHRGYIRAATVLGLTHRLAGHGFCYQIKLDHGGITFAGRRALIALA